MDNHWPHLIVIAGPNGAGKSTTAPSLLKGALEVTEFVNADLLISAINSLHFINSMLPYGYADTRCPFASIGSTRRHSS